MAGLFDVFTNKNAQDAANAQIAGINAGQNAATGAINAGNQALTTNFMSALQPYQTNYGQAQGGVNQYLAALGIGGAGGAAGGNAIQDLLSNTPGYQFQLNQGNQNVLRNAAQTGTLASGATLNALQTQGQGLANNTYQQYLSNLQPFLGASAGAAGGIAGTYTGLGTALNQNQNTLANLGWTANTAIGNANANADLANNAASANMWGALLGGANLLTGGLSGGSLGISGSPELGPFAKIGMANAGTFGGYAEGGDPPVGQPSIVGEEGPEIFVPKQPGTIIPNHFIKLLMNALHSDRSSSGGDLVPIPGARLSATPMSPLTRAVGPIIAPDLTDYLETGSRYNPRVQPSGKIADPEWAKRIGGVGQDVSNMLQTLMGAFAPEEFATRLAPRAAEAAAPSAAATSARAMRPVYDMATAAGAGAASTSPAQAGTIEGPGERPTMTPDETKQIGMLQSQISDLTAKRQAAVAKATRGIGPKGAEIRGNAASAPFDAQIKAINDQIAAINGQVNDRMVDYDKRKAIFDATTAPWAEKNPNAASAAHAAAFLLSPLTGGWLGRRVGLANPNLGAGKRLMTYLSSGMGGGIEGTLSALGPTQIDTEASPGTRAKEEADKSWSDPNFWLHSVAPEVGIAAMESMLGTKYGLTSTIRPVANAASASARIGAAAKARAQMAAQVKLFQDEAGRWQRHGGGGFASKDEISQWQKARPAKPQGNRPPQGPSPSP